mmetsp:Transcript_25511/g.60693  ORF Transcript_25511/g.60693 Transcript_25511/m.60693 type:complete len:210 (+) Transcript_25511:1490-2119(+)
MGGKGKAGSRRGVFLAGELGPRPRRKGMVPWGLGGGPLRAWSQPGGVPWGGSRGGRMRSAGPASGPAGPPASAAAGAKAAAAARVGFRFHQGLLHRQRVQLPVPVFAVRAGLHRGCVPPRGVLLRTRQHASAPKRQRLDPAPGRIAQNAEAATGDAGADDQDEPGVDPCRGEHRGSSQQAGGCLFWQGQSWRGGLSSPALRLWEGDPTS